MMLRFIADENFDNGIIEGLFQRRADIDLVRVQDVGLRGEDDPAILEWAANENRILLTHDIHTMTHFAYERVRNGQFMLGVLEVRKSLSIGVAIEHIILVAECSFDGELEDKVIYIPIQ